MIGFTLPETNIAPENGPSQKETSLPTIFRCELLVSESVCFNHPKCFSFEDVSPIENGIFRCHVSFRGVFGFIKICSLFFLSHLYGSEGDLDTVK